MERGRLIDNTNKGIGQIQTDISNINYNWDVILHNFYIVDDDNYFMLESDFEIFDKHNNRPVILNNLSEYEREHIWKVIFDTKKYHYDKYAPDMVLIRLSDKVYSQERVNRYIYEMTYNNCVCIQNKFIKSQLNYGNNEAIKYYYKNKLKKLNENMKKINIHPTIESFINENKKELNYYTTSYEMSIDEFIEIEVEERENYELKDVKKWIKKYRIKDDEEIIWVATEPYIAARYEMDSNDWDNAEEVYNNNPDEYNVRTIYSNEGILIPESDDGDDGFIFILRK
jgi:hypothetical protein